ncbi:Transcription factor IIIB 60 kDa subunit [Cercospora zeina]
MPPPTRPRRPPLGSINRPAVPPRKRAPAKPAAPSAKKCPNKECGGTSFSEDDGKVVCLECYTEIAENNIVAEVTFEENAGGRATVQGGTVNESSRHARTLGSSAYRKVGGGERNSLADVQNAGRKALEQLCPKLGILQQVQIQAEQIWVLAANINFSAGRRTDEVVAACLYAACRRQRDNKILLMDIAELLQINVFRLGEVYKDMCRELYITQDHSVGHQHLVELEPLIYKYCDKLQFAEKTKDVASDALKIIRRMNRDWIVSGRHPAGLCGACIILAARMNNFQRTVREVVFVSKVADVTIAKRVEEFRRTKASGLTVDNFRKYANRMVHQHNPPSCDLPDHNARKFARAKARRKEHMEMLEMRASQMRSPSAQHIVLPDDVSESSSRLSSLEAGSPGPVQPVTASVQQVPATAPMIVAQEPASAGEQQSTPPPTQSNEVSNSDPTEGNAKRKRMDEAEDAAPADVVSATRAESPKRQRTERSAPPQLEPQSIIRYDADGFAIPALPAQAVADATRASEAPTEKRGRGRPKKDPAQAPEVEISQEELAEEDYLETQIEEALANGEVQEMQSEVEKIKEAEKIEAEHQRAAALAAEQMKADGEKGRQARLARGVDYFGKAPEWEPGVILTAAELEAEFENDPEVANCILSDTERKIKEQIWVAHNEDWLRKQAEKELLAKVEKANPTKKKKDGKTHKGRGKKRNTLGDGTVLTESSTPIETPADAARAMLEKRAPMKSQHVNFGALQRIYGRETPSRAGSAIPSESRSQTPTTRAPSAAPSEGNEDGSEEGDVEEVQTENPAKHVQPATWDNMDEDGPVEEEDDEDIYKMATEGHDEFGSVYGGDDDYGSGEEYG